MTVTLKGYVKSADGSDAGTYEALTSKFKSVEITRSLFEGDVMKIVSSSNAADSSLHSARAIRLYDGATKLFDGYSRSPGYYRKGNNRRDLTNEVYDWRKELEAITITETADYVDETIDTIMADLCRHANNSGVEKAQVYKYDTSKLPYHPAVFGTATVSFSPTKSVWSAIMDMTRFMDMVETDIPGQWTVKVDSLQSDDNIYLIPILLRTENRMAVWDNPGTGETFTALQSTATAADIWVQTDCIIDVADLVLTIEYKDQGDAASSVNKTIPIGTAPGTYLAVTLAGGDTAVKEITNVTYSSGVQTGERVYVIGREQGVRKLPDVKLVAPKSTSKNYAGLMNWVVVTGGGGLATQTVRSTKILTQATISGSPYNDNSDNNTTKMSYLKVTLTNPTAGALAGTVEILCDAGSAAAEYSDYFYIRIPVGETVWHVTKNRFAPNTGMVITCTGLNGGTIQIEEILHGIAGRSVNLYGLRAGSMTVDELDTQARIDSFSDGVIELNHAPKVNLSAVVKPDYVDTSDNIGDIIEFYDDILSANARYLCSRQVLTFTGADKRERIEAIRYNTDWEYTE